MESRSCNNFTSYVGLEEHEMQPLGPSRRESLVENTIKLLGQEVVIAEAHNVLMFCPVGDSKQGISGALYVTNFKLAFATSNDSDAEQQEVRQQNHLYGSTETCLSNIDEIYLMYGDRKRKVLPGFAVPAKVKGIFVVCKNLRTWSFSFKFSPVGHGKDVLTTLLHHAFPSRHQLLFAYDYKEAYYSSVDKGVRFFRDKSDWENELRRTTRGDAKYAKNWRLSSANAQFQLSSSLPQYIIVPACVTDSQLSGASGHFQGNRPPVWSWSNERGAALVKMAELSATVAERTQENIMLENIRKCHPQRWPLAVVDLNKGVTVKSVGTGFAKFVGLCTPENIRQFWLQDNNFYSSLENTKWLKFVSYCLQKSVESSEELEKGNSVILQEGAGRDVCSIVSSLVQLLLDPHFRTITGFQSLLQKEWVAAGHPFCDRLGHIVKPDCEKSPLFLLYLDCVWQLCQQFPTHFEFTETYLTTVWDTAHVSTFDTFLFNCERDRAFAATDSNTPLRVLRSAWDWREQFNEQDILLFYNPLFDRDSLIEEKASLKPAYAIPFLELWSQCYFRWIPPLEIRNGGKNHIELYSRLLINAIGELRLDADAARDSPVEKLNTYLLQTNIDSFYPFGNKNSGNNISTPIMNSSILMTESLIDAQSLLTAPD